MEALNKLDITGKKKETTLPQVGSWPETVHVFEEKNLWAIKMALAAERPLLIRGEPGSGKSQLARAAACLSERAFIPSVVHARSECQDLLYHFDAVRRLGEAQAMAAAGGKKEDVQAAMLEGRFISPGPLWWAFDWLSAEKQVEDCIVPTVQPEKPKNWSPADGCVLLIDEIDKADADLPNGLLETLGNGAFNVPTLGQTVGLTQEAPPPLVIITTNEERELPQAFLRRCLVLHLNLPEEDAELLSYLCTRGKAHFGESCSDTVRKKAAEMLLEDRKKAHEYGLAKPGQAEYLDILRALSKFGEDAPSQLAALESIAEFALKKQLPEYS